jgi:glucoamylase
MAAHSLRRVCAIAGGASVVLALLATSTSAPATAAGRAPGSPGSLSHFDLARKDCVGTARSDTSKVWFTVADGVLSDVYEPTIDNTNVHTLQYVVTGHQGGHPFTDLQSRDLSYTVTADPAGMECTVTATSAAHGYTLTTRYLTDPVRDSVVMRTALSGPRSQDLRVYARLDAIVNGNGGGGSANGGADDGIVTAAGVPVVSDPHTVTQAANRDYAVPTSMALTSDRQGPASVGYADSASDGLTSLDRTQALARWTDAPDGHVVATEQVNPHPGTQAFTLALGFGRTPVDAVRTAQRSTQGAFAALEQAYRKTWRQYDAGLRRPTGLGPARQRAYWLSANVLKASEDKTFHGAIAASLSSPWGQAVSAGDLPGGQPVYFGSYREVFSRDLYEAVTGMLAVGDVATARAATRFLFERQQTAAGNMPRNSLLNGEAAPDTGGVQLDETAYPVLMAYLTGLSADHALYADHVRPAADYLVSHGPSFGNERWEEQGGYSPSTIAAEIAGLTAAAHIAHVQGDDAHARTYQAVADDFQRTVKQQTVTSTGSYSPTPYFTRLTKNGDPDSAVSYGLGNGSIDADQRDVVDGGFQELVRLGELPATDADVQRSLSVVDDTIARTTPTGTGYYRYGTSAAGSEDGYGDCWTPDATACPLDGQPWPTTDTGSGHLWPVLSGERAETALATGDRSTARSQLRFMLRSAAGVGLVPEQVWENPDLAPSPYDADPTTASIGFRDGQPAGSASPLTWAQAQLVRLLVDLQTHQIVDRPDLTTARYVDQAPPGAVPVSIDTPHAGDTVSGATTVTGTTTPGATVDVSLVGNDSPGSSMDTTTAGSDGSWTAHVDAVFGSDRITAAATTATGTGVARVDVVGDLAGGTTILDVTDPPFDDHGPGTFEYPTSSNFHDGAFDITRFQVLQQGDTVYLRTTLRDLTDTFGLPDGAQLLDIFVRQPGAPAYSTDPPFATRRFSIAPDSAWSQRLEVQGFAAPVWQAADGGTVGTPTAVVASPATKTITIALPAAQFGTPGSGWTFAVTLHGQDGYSSDQARGFQPTPQEYQFGLCAPGGTSPICSIDPSTAPKVMDVIAPAGVDQSTELDPTQGAVTIHGVNVP